MKQPEGMQQAAISLSVDDFYLADEHVTIRVELIHAVAEITSLGAKIQPVGSAAPGTVRQFTQVGDRWILTIEDLPAGLYSIEVETQYAGPNSPRPVHSFFGIVAP